MSRSQRGLASSGQILVIHDLVHVLHKKGKAMYKLSNGDISAKGPYENLYTVLKNYTPTDIVLLEEEIRLSACAYSKALDKNKSFGALDVFCDSDHTNFMNDFPRVQKFIQDWLATGRSSKSARCQFGRIFYQVLNKDI